MPLVPELKHSLRNPGEPHTAVGLDPPEDIFDNDNDNGGDVHEFDVNGNTIKIIHADGGATISIDGRPLDDEEDKKPTEWFDNLVEEIPSTEVGRIAEDIIRGVESDNSSRKEWLDTRTLGIRLMGLSLESSDQGSVSDGAPVEGMSKVRHPLLQEAVLRFQANARSELLPTDGPAKIRNDSNNAGVTQDELANALEKDFNHYLTTVATEFYPDTDRMLLMLGFGGTAFKKVYFCPLRNRPVSEHVDAEDLIVSNDATDLKNAKRVTHRVMMKPSTVKRLQILGVYRDVKLSDPDQPEVNEVKREKMRQQGVTDDSTRPEDRDRELYECYCELDIPGFEHKAKGKITGLELPYRVTIDVSSKEILSIVRNYDEDTKKLPETKSTFVKYTFVPGFGFYDIGLVHILGNTTMAATSAWRELLDLGMFANFPGFLISDMGMRQATNVMRVPPGGGYKVQTNGMPINQAVMPLPYNMGAAPSLMALVQDMVQTGQRVGGTAEMPVGEGKQDAPVGTTLALIDGATKVINSVHKRTHAAQASELQLIAECFKEHPKSFWEKNRRPAYKWDEETFLQALGDCNLIPQSDPNTSSTTQRMMKVAALFELWKMFPNLYDPIALNQMAIREIGYGNPEEFMAPPESMGKAPPELVKMQQETQAKLMTAQSGAIMAKAKADEVQAKSQIDAARLKIDMGKGQGGPEPLDVAKAKTAMMDAQTRARQADTEQADTAIRAKMEERNNASDAHLQTMKMATEVLKQHGQMALERERMALDHSHHIDDTRANAESEQKRMAFEDQHKSADRNAKSSTESEKLKVMSKAKAAAKPKAKK